MQVPIHFPSVLQHAALSRTHTERQFGVLVQSEAPFRLLESICSSLRNDSLQTIVYSSDRVKIIQRSHAYPFLFNEYSLGLLNHSSSFFLLFLFLCFTLHQHRDNQRHLIVHSKYFIFRLEIAIFVVEDYSRRT